MSVSELSTIETDPKFGSLATATAIANAAALKEPFYNVVGSFDV